MLQELIKKCDEFQTVTLRLNSISFNSCLHALSNNPRKEHLMKAESLLDEMWTMSKEGNPEIAPNAITTNTIISAWAKSNVDGSAHHAEMVLKQMQDM